MAVVEYLYGVVGGSVQAQRVERPPQGGAVVEQGAQPGESFGRVEQRRAANHLTQLQRDDRSALTRSKLSLELNKQPILFYSITNILL